MIATIVDWSRLARALAAPLMALALAGCSGGGDPPPPAASAPGAAEEEPEPEAYPETVPTPIGISGEIVDRRSSLPAGYDAPTGALDPARAYGQVVRLGPGDPTLRFLVWNACPRAATAIPCWPGTRSR